ncbi:hypothetical protein EW145_g8426 [Phellinidium pouzarii]|uniref:Sorting nexin protein WASP-binding domain-containing protein n=1 Tax=Phellinidium pouzarii TaxID=167371 RepID=A0A4S4K659_9AGAM|nr:hypothetical protein EW145_g8426 [Phellinidium pouzarii]
MFFLGCESDVEWRRELSRYFTPPPSSFFSRVFYPAFHFDAEDAEDAGVRFAAHAGAVGAGVQQLREGFGKVRGARVEMASAERLLSYSLLSLITCTPLASGDATDSESESESESESKSDTGSLTVTDDGRVKVKASGNDGIGNHDCSDSNLNGINDEISPALPASHPGSSSRFSASRSSTGHVDADTESSVRGKREGRRKRTGKGLVNEEGAWCWREDCADCLRLTKCMQKTAETLQGVADLYEDHARRTMLATEDLLKDVAHPDTIYAPVLDIHKTTLSRYKEYSASPSSTPDALEKSDEDDAAARCETVLNTTMAEFEVYHGQKQEDFARITKGHLDDVNVGYLSLSIGTSLHLVQP